MGRHSHSRRCYGCPFTIGRQGHYVADSVFPPQTPADPFPQLQRLQISIDAATTMQPLAQLLRPASSSSSSSSSGLTRLSVFVRDVRANASPAFAPLATCLPQLRALHLSFDDNALFCAADLGALHGLAQLSELRLYFGVAADVRDDDLAALGRALRRLRVLELWLDLPGLSPGALRAVGEARPQLRRLLLGGEHDLSAALDREPETPLFPRLEYLHLLSLDLLDRPNLR